MGCLLTGVNIRFFPMFILMPDVRAIENQNIGMSSACLVLQKHHEAVKKQKGFTRFLVKMETSAHS